ncbi:B12-binding domain-containing radical SAM protein [Candidatus Bathyarchaeota archaeon]|nr:B12-binding domain-containing radical SAM protein [Candidatus Bathyarchaeota archaeon]
MLLEKSYGLEKGYIMKFSFINPGPNPELPIEDVKKMVGAAPPLGMLYIATYLRENGVDISIIDEAAQGYSLKDIIDWVKKEDPEILGFSTCSSSGRKAALIAEKVKSENPNMVTVFGNFYATFNAERILKKYPFVDAIIRGEGEHTSLELAKCLEKNGDLKKVLGINFRDNGKIISTPDRPLIKDVDSLPFPDRELLDVEYHNTTAGIVVAPKKFSSFVSSRGCVFRCRFCGCRRLARSLWRSRSVDNIMEELHLLSSQGYKQFLFVDDNFTLNTKRVIKLCRRLKKEKVDIEFFAEGRVDNCPRDMLQEMSRANCKMMYFGIENGTQKVLDYYDKQTTTQQAIDALKAAKKSGIDVTVASFILGAPHETRQEILNTLKYAQKIEADIPQFNILATFPGTDIWEELKMHGLIDEEKHWETGVLVSEVSPDAVPTKEIEQMIHDGYQRFFIRPNYIVKQLLRIGISSYRFNVLLSNLKRANTVAEGIRDVT